MFAPKGFTEIRNKIYKQEDLFNSSHTRMAYMFWQLMHAEEPYLTDDLSEEMMGMPKHDWLFVAMSIRFACSS